MTLPLAIRQPPAESDALVEWEANVNRLASSEASGCISEPARKLGITWLTLYREMARLGLRR